ncbi:MAG: peptidase M28 [Nitriliruptorales bacterium]|nr:peptidase M28 [Nitriliruptorales bacterium]
MHSISPVTERRRARGRVLFSRRVVAVLGALLLTLTAAPAAVAQQDTPLGREPDERGHWNNTVGKPVEQPAPSRKLPAQPRNDEILDVPVDNNDASIPLNLIPYHEFPARLRALQDSDRISVEIIGKSTQDRNLYMAVATSPMSDTEWTEWQRLSDLRTDDPDAAVAAFEAGAYDNWKTPLLANNNIHGNEWEGTDGAFQVLDVLANSDEEEVVELLDEHVIAVVISMNPDGRVNGVRANSEGFDVNRDFVTQSQPEVRAVRDQLIRYNPLTMIDLHGYVTCTLIEPTTGPHGEAYEYDLYIRQAIRNALTMEQAVIATGETRATCATPDGGRRVDMPWRDDLSGWDDWPPIFTPMYAMLHGAVGHTIEIPLNPRSTALTVPERHERTRINTAVARAAYEGNLEYVNSASDDLLADQLEIFRRGEHGESSRPIDDELSLSLARNGVFQGYNVDNAETFLQDFPDAYVIPLGRGQRSDNAAARLAQFLIDNDVEVKRAHSGFTLDGVEYRQGSYVVDMHQAKRAVAYALLYTGRDVTENFPTMYDISAWSQGELWGADFEVVQDGALEEGVLRDITSAGHVGSVAPGKVSRYGFEVDSPADVRAVNWLAETVALSRRDDGVFVVPGSARSAVTEAARTFGVHFTNLGPAKAGEVTTPVDRLRVGVSTNNDEAYALRSMGFEIQRVTHGGFNDAAYTFDDFDAMYVSTTSFNPNGLTGDRVTAFSEWLADGGAVVGRGIRGVTFNNDAALLRSATGGNLSTAAGPGRANGIVTVDNHATSPITGDALGVSFVSAPRWFTNPGTDVRIDQRLGTGSFLLAGHWIGGATAAGQPVIVSGQARGANVTLFTTEPLYRSHPEGLWEQVAEGLWAEAG